MNEPRLSIIPGWIIADPRLKGKDLQVLCMLGRNANTRHGWCRRSQVKLAQALACSRSTVQSAITRLVEIGAVERREVASPNGRDSAHWYRVIYDSNVDSSAFDAWDEDDQKEFDPNLDFDKAAPPAGIPAPPADPRQAPPACSGPAPINASTLTPPDKRTERERARGDLEEDQNDDPAKFPKRVKALEIGRHSNPWPDAIGSSTDWAIKQFAKLTAEERNQAEERRDVYLDECKRRRIKPVALGVYLRDRKFLDVAAVVKGAAHAASERIAVAPFGPIWAGLCVSAYLDGPVEIEYPQDLRATVTGVFETMRRSSEARALSYIAKKGIELSHDGSLIFPDDFEQADYRVRVMEGGFPEVKNLYRLATARERGTSEGKYSVFSDLCEPVPVGSEVFEAWRAHYQAMDWLWIPDTGRMPVVWFPKGGPERLDEFRRAVMEIKAKGMGDDAAQV